MAQARVSAEQVKELISTELTDSVILASMIDTANVFVDTHLVPDANHGAPILNKIELYLAAHFVAISEEKGAVKFSKVGDASDAFDVSNLGSGFNSTRFGQTALSLDTSGILAAVATSNLKAQFRVI